MNLLYEARRLWWRLNPRRAESCGDLACKCRSCTTPGCDCAAERFRWDEGDIVMLNEEE